MLLIATPVASWTDLETSTGLLSVPTAYVPLFKEEGSTKPSGVYETSAGIFAPFVEGDHSRCQYYHIKPCLYLFPGQNIFCHYNYISCCRVFCNLCDLAFCECYIWVFLYLPVKLLISYARSPYVYVENGPLNPDTAPLYMSPALKKPCSIYMNSKADGFRLCFPRTVQMQCS